MTAVRHTSPLGNVHHNGLADAPAAKRRKKTGEDEKQVVPRGVKRSSQRQNFREPVEFGLPRLEHRRRYDTAALRALSAVRKSRRPLVGGRLFLTEITARSDSPSLRFSAGKAVKNTGEFRRKDFQTQKGPLRRERPFKRRKAPEKEPF